MKMMAWIAGLVLFLSGSSAVAAGDSDTEGSRIGKKKPKCACPAPKYGGQGKEKCNHGHGNNEDGVDSSNPGKSKPGEDTDPNDDDEKKSGGGTTQGKKGRGGSRNND